MAVADLAAGAHRLETEYGLRALEGGRHPGVGTANMIVPLGSAYLELITIVDPEEASRAPTAGRVARAIAEGRTFATWAVRTDNVDTLREHLHEGGWTLPVPSPGARVRPDGVTLRWRTQVLALSHDPSVLPFFIEWSVPPGMHPAEMPVDHPSKAQGIRLVRLGDPHPAAASNKLRSVLGKGVNFEVEEAPVSGVLAVEVNTPSGVISIR